MPEGMLSTENESIALDPVGEFVDGNPRLLATLEDLSGGSLRFSFDGSVSDNVTLEGSGQG
jgi:hypothetical protein